uniref:Fe2OG dioxygenase domain-containing protein n=1 Tax=Dracunculus medinensis TaxID=318479 RepID=A0A0N4UAS7_DRAME
LLSFEEAFVLKYLTISINDKNNDKKFPSLIVVTVATDETDGFRRLKQSADVFGIEIQVYGLGEKWTGGDTRIEQGGGQKIQILRKALEPYKDRKDLIILFVDAYDVIFNEYPSQILTKFFEYFGDYRILFSAEPYCWPEKMLAAKYPLITFGYRYLNSGLFMGYAPEIWKLINIGLIKDNDDDQLYYTKIYLNENFRTSLKMTLDSLSIIFQNLNGVQEDIDLEFDDSGDVYNAAHNTHPVIVHGNGPSKIFLNYLGNYIAKSRSLRIGAQKNFVDLMVIILLSIFIIKPIPFIDEFLSLVEKLQYPGRVCLYFYNNQEYNKITEKSESKNIHFSFSVRNLKKLKIELKIFRDIIAPLVAQPNKLFTNFWGALSKTGYYARSADYLDIVNRKIVGFWNVPFISSIFLMAKNKLKAFVNAYDYDSNIDADMSFCKYARDFGHFLYIDNQQYVGFLVNSENFDTSKQHPEMYQIFDNRALWEARYIHEKYDDILMGKEFIDEPCPDVFDFPFMSKRFCLELIEEMEHFGQWSSGTHMDHRIAGGYENVPTRDIHMNQIDFERHWLYILDEYVRPIQEQLFLGYYHQPIESHMMFVVRYKPDEQASLRPHHDASTYSIDVALNKQGVDFQGGGVRFVRYNCTAAAHRVGYSLIFPGRLTHLHEGLPTTNGTRYIAVSFINP